MGDPIKPTKTATQILRRAEDQAKDLDVHVRHLDSFGYCLKEMGAPKMLHDSLNDLIHFAESQKLRIEDEMRWMTEVKREPITL